MALKTFNRFRNPQERVRQATNRIILLHPHQFPAVPRRHLCPCCLVRHRSLPVGCNSRGNYISSGEARDAMVKLTDHESLSSETVRRRLAENDLKPWRKDMWCIPQVDGEYVARMENVLDLYAEAPDPERPVVCFDETPVQLIGEVRQPIPAEPGQLERYDYEYRRHGTVNLFVVFDPHRAWRKVKVTERRTAKDYAHCMRELVDVHYPEAACIRVVQDNLSIHTVGALYEAFAPAEARRILRRLEFHHTPKHASWLNMVEIEIGVLRGQCLDRRIDDPKRLRREIDAWERQRNEARARIKWMFTTDKARTKMGRAYPRTAKES